MAGHVAQLLDMILLLLREKSREVVKSVLGFVKVAVVILSPEVLGMDNRLASIVKGLLLWASESKNRFKMKIRFLIERLVRKLGVEAVQNVIPKQDKGTNKLTN